MSYCTIEEAWGNNFSITNVSNKNKKVRGLPTSFASNNPSVSDLIKVNGKNKHRNQYTRDVHSKRSRNKRINQKEHKTDFLNLSSDTTGDYTYLDQDMDLYSSDNTKSLMYNPMILNDNDKFNNKDSHDDNYNSRDQLIIPSEEHYEPSSEEHYEPSLGEQFGSLNTNIIEHMPPYGGLNNSVEYETNNNQSNNNLQLATNNNNNNDKIIVPSVKLKPETNIPMSSSSKMLVEILDRLDRLERKMDKSEGSNIHDITLFILMGIFVLFILDSIFRIGRMTI